MYRPDGCHVFFREAGHSWEDNENRMYPVFRGFAMLMLDNVFPINIFRRATGVDKPWRVYYVDDAAVVERGAFHLEPESYAAEGALRCERVPAEDAVAGGALAVANLSHEEECGVGDAAVVAVVAVSSTHHWSRARNKQ